MQDSPAAAVCLSAGSGCWLVVPGEILCVFAHYYFLIHLSASQQQYRQLYGSDQSCLSIPVGLSVCRVHIHGAYNEETPRVVDLIAESD